MYNAVRGQPVGYGQSIQLKVLFKDSTGTATDLTTFPQIQITDPTATIYMDYTSTSVYHVSTGTYAYDFTVPLDGPVGVWSDNWSGIMGIDTVGGSFNFVVSNIPLAGYIDGYEQLGDEPALVLSQTAIQNLNVLMHILRRRLQSSGWHMIKDANGVLVRESCDIFSIDELFTFLCSSLSEFNSTPHYTGFTWEDQTVLDFRDVIVEGAYIIALASKALIEKGREFTISDNGLSFQPPMVADLLNSQFSSMLSVHVEKLKQVKYSMKASPLGLGCLTIQGISPAVSRLRHRRENQWFRQ